MLRDLLLLGRRRSDDELIFMNTPGNPIEQNDQIHTPIDPLDDVFGSVPSSPMLNAASNVEHQRPQATHRHAADPSDIPRLRSIHVTSGYREGIAASKEQHIQAGFDEGYSLGGEIGIKAGWYLGILEGLLHPPRLASAQGDVEASVKDELHEMYRQAQKELEMNALLNVEYFGPDGVWLYDVPGQDDEGELKVTFADVAAAHPVLRKWDGIVTGIAEKFGVPL